ncbi:hypothetical protein Btru_008606 [Bulinus truncatus]|nr:hypothetical protein Btru_008606 [Bulinus truncatus]
MTCGYVKKDRKCLKCMELDVIRLHFILFLLLSPCCSVTSANYNDCPASNGSQTLHHGQKVCDTQSGNQTNDQGVHCTLCYSGHLLNRRCYTVPGINRHNENLGTSEHILCYNPDGYPNKRVAPTPYPTEDCNTQNCKLPDCFCYGARPSLSLYDTPMFVVVTFDDGIYIDSYQHQLRPFFVDNDYSLFNPDGCRLKSTFFVSMDNTVTPKVTDLWKAGNEISGHTADHGLPSGLNDTDYNATVEAIDGMRRILVEETYDSNFVNSIIGFRAPYLRVAHETQYKVLRDLGFIYDTSLVSKSLFRDGTPLWPYTLDYKYKRCDHKFCPQDSYPGMWEVPLNVWVGDDQDYCSMLDYCTVGHNSSTASAKQWFEYFLRNFELSYLTKTPLSFYTHAHLFDVHPNSFQGFIQWLQHITKHYKDAWFVTVQQLLHWMKHPLTHQQMLEIKWGC